MKKFLRATLTLSRVMDGVAGTVLVLIMLLTSVDVVLRYLGRPIPGTYDMVTLAAAFVIGFAIPRTSWDRANVTVDILVDHLPRQKVILHVITRLFGLFFFLMLGWNLVKTGFGFLRTGDSTQTLSLPFYPVCFALGVCAFVECIVLVSDLVRAGGSHA